MEGDKRQSVDDRLRRLGVEPQDLGQLIERYAGSARLDVTRADALLNTLAVRRWESAPAPPPDPLPELEPEPEEARVMSLSDAAPAFAPETETDGPPVVRVDARLARQVSTRKNTPFPGGIAGAEEMPAFASRRSLTPRPFGAPDLSKPRPPLPASLIPPLAAAAAAAPPVVDALPPPPITGIESKSMGLEVLEEAAAASSKSLPRPAGEDDFEIIVDDEIVEIEPDEIVDEPPNDVG